jgi:hypothetical protein
MYIIHLNLNKKKNNTKFTISDQNRHFSFYFLRNYGTSRILPLSKCKYMNEKGAHSSKAIIVH